MNMAIDPPIRLVKSTIVMQNLKDNEWVVLKMNKTAIAVNFLVAVSKMKSQGDLQLTPIRARSRQLKLA
jgi:hypothetical protein